MDRKKRLINILKQNSEPISAKQLGELFGVSDRSIRHYIKELRYQGYIIKSDEKGYLLISDIPNSTLESNNSDEFYIIEKIIFNSKGTKINDLTDALFISNSTLEKKLKNIKQLLATYNLEINRNSKILTITGNEKDKRRFISDYFFNNSIADTTKTINSLCLLLNISLDKIKAIINQCLEKHNIYTSDYALKSILIHILICLSRIKISNYILKEPFYNIPKQHGEEYLCAKDIYENIKKIIDIPENEYEIDQLSFVIQTKTNKIINEHILQKIADDRIILFVQDIIKDINKTYCIDLSDSDFINFFTVHLSNVLYRCKYNIFNSNPLADQIYIQNPLIYDISVFIALHFKEIFGYSLNRDEITFISLHVGAVLEKKSSDPLLAILITDRYYPYKNSALINKLNNSLRKCRVVASLNSLDNDSALMYDFVIIATNNFLPKENKPSIKVSTFLDDKDLMKINLFADELRLNNKKKIFSRQLHEFFKPDMFEYNHYEKDSSQMIRYVTKKIIDKGLADDYFSEAVLQREKATPTSFDNGVAIPHSMNSSTKKNCAYVIINENSMPWGYFNVNIIIVLGINHSQRAQFKSIYSNLLECFEDPLSIHNLMQCKTFDEFIDTLISSIK